MADQIAIAEPLAGALANKGYDTLTPVQEAVLDPALASEDLLVSAQTGSGKTVAFGLALATSLLGDSLKLPSAGAPLALIIAPTRELALQVTRELQWLYAPAGGKIASCIGGMDTRDERRALNKGVHIVVGTPGRLVDHIKRNALDMDNLRAVVLDEADEMLNMGFREELEEILSAAPEKRRTLLFSATVSKPIARLAENYQKNAVRLNTVSVREQHVDIEYQAFSVSPSDIEKAVINLLLFHDAPNALVFCARRDGVNKLASRLTNRGLSVVALSGEFSQKERNNSLLAMRDGRARVCVATDVAARGLDLPGLDLVIHADLPQNREALLHRSGRTGRAGRKGVCALIVPVRARRRTERLLRDAAIEADWAPPPSPTDIQKRLDERLLSHPVLDGQTGENERGLTDALLAKFSPEQLATAFVRLTKAKQSAPEELQAAVDEPRRRERGDRPRRDFDDGPPSGRRDRARGAPQPRFENNAWISLAVGRKTNADPKWLLPMLCKSGGFERDQIGVIQIGTSVTHVEMKPAAANRLMEIAGDRKVIDKSLSIDRAAGPGPVDEGDDRTPHAGDKRERTDRRPRTKPHKKARVHNTKSFDRNAAAEPAGGSERPNDRKERASRAEPGETSRKDKPTWRTGPKTGNKFAKKKRTGPKKPRGPNGEKKRSANHMAKPPKRPAGPRD